MTDVVVKLNWDEMFYIKTGLEDRIKEIQEFFKVTTLDNSNILIVETTKELYFSKNALMLVLEIYDRMPLEGNAFLSFKSEGDDNENL